MSRSKRRSLDRRPHGETIADDEISTVDGSCSKLNRRERGERGRRPPGAQAPNDFRDSAVPSDEDHVDWKSHPACVNRVARRNDHRLPVSKILTSE